MFSRLWFSFAFAGMFLSSLEVIRTQKGQRKEMETPFQSLIVFLPQGELKLHALYPNIRQPDYRELG